MKDKFEDWIQGFSKLKEGWNSLPEFHRVWFGIQIKNYKDEAVEECNTLHQQAMKEKLKEVLKLIDEAIEKSRDYTCSYDYLCNRFYDIAKENNIEL